MKTRDITVSVTLDWAPMLAQLDALAEHVRALVDAPVDGDREEGALVTDPADLAAGDRVSFTLAGRRYEDVWLYKYDGVLCAATDPVRYGDAPSDVLMVHSDGSLNANVSDVRVLSRDGNTPPASQNGPQDARSADSGTGGPPEPENATQGRIGWIRLKPGDERRLLTREVPGGWTDTDLADDLTWLAEDWPDAEFEPIRTLADDEVAVKREEGIGPEHVHYLRAVAFDLDGDGDLDAAKVIRAYAAALEAGEDRG